MGEIKTMTKFLYEVNEVLTVSPLYKWGTNFLHRKTKAKKGGRSSEVGTNDLFLATQQMFSLLDLDVVIKEAFRYSK